MMNTMSSPQCAVRLSWVRHVLHGAIISMTLAAWAMPVRAQENPPTGFGCGIQNNNTGETLPAGAHGDPLFKIVTSQKFCPNNALEFRNLLKQLGLKLNPAMVADRGFNNPLPQGLFSFFEAVTGDYEGNKIEPGDWFFGHFQVAVNNNTAGTSVLQEQNQGSDNALLLESVVWDPTIGMFRFYEIRGNGQGGTWFYRGSSLDILDDIKNVWRNSNPGEPLFGRNPDLAKQDQGGPRLRCSGCHMNGGPIMKELAFPHNMWWRKERPLPLGSLVIQPAIQGILDDVVDASVFSKWIDDGYTKLFSSKRYMDERGKLTLQEQLRVIFCEQEVNLASDTTPLGDPNAKVVQAPVGFFVDPRLLPDGPKFVEIKKDLYVNALNHFQSQFFDVQSSDSIGIDADHGFSSPVKSHSDMLLAEAMVKAKIVDMEFVIDVLAVDMTRPMFSKERCNLLQLVPDRADDDWLEEFKGRLEASSSPAAAELLANLTDPKRDIAYHQKQAAALVKTLQKNAENQDIVTGWVRLLSQRRIEVFRSQISQHPQGQIFEPEFRLLFPTLNLLKADQNESAYGGVPDQYWLNPETGTTELSAQ